MLALHVPVNASSTILWHGPTILAGWFLVCCPKQFGQALVLGCVPLACVGAVLTSFWTQKIAPGTIVSGRHWWRLECQEIERETTWRMTFVGLLCGLCGLRCWWRWWWYGLFGWLFGLIGEDSRPICPGLD